MYDFIWRAKQELGSKWAEKFTLYFFLFYDADGAAKAANDPHFWDYVYANYPTARRGKERRHMRGDNGIKALNMLSNEFNEPSKFWDAVSSFTYTDLVENIAQNFVGCQIGPYFTWKLMDLLDRALGDPVRLSRWEAVKYLPEEPQLAIKTFWPGLDTGLVLEQVVKEIHYQTAPGDPNRMCSYAEAETVLCAMRGYWVKNNYYIGKDIKERREQLVGHPELLKYMPGVPGINFVKGDLVHV